MYSRHYTSVDTHLLPIGVCVPRLKFCLLLWLPGPSLAAVFRSALSGRSGTEINRQHLLEPWCGWSSHRSHCQKLCGVGYQSIRAGAHGYRFSQHNRERHIMNRPLSVLRSRTDKGVELSRGVVTAPSYGKSGSSQKSVHVERDLELKSMSSIRYLGVSTRPRYPRGNSCSLGVWSRQRSNCRGFE